jgi:predicted dehydrogenase
MSFAPGTRVRYGVVGAGWISQQAFMPGVDQTGNSQLAALVTGDEDKARVLSARYGIRAWGYEQYDELLASGEIDAVYIALPNFMHRDYAVRALDAGLHVLLEKPMAIREADCIAIRDAAARNNRRLMIAYRLHTEPGTLAAVELMRRGAIGEIRAFSSLFSQQVTPSNHRAEHGFWSGPVADMGPYPINTARMLFGAEPVEVSAVGVRHPHTTFDFDDTVSVTMRFPDERLAQFTVSYFGAPVDQYRVLGTHGDLEVSPGFMFGSDFGVKHRLTIEGETSEHEFPATDQFGSELHYFSECILDGREPEPDGDEGLADVRIIEAIRQALETGEAQKLAPFTRARRPEPEQVVELPPVQAPELIHAAAPDS